MKRLVILIALMFIYSCISNSKEITHKKNVPHIHIDKSLLNGVWGDDSNENALFYIQNDSIYYTEQQEHPYLIDLVNDSIKIYFNDTIFSSKILKLSKDSLILQTAFETSKLYRIKE